MQEIIQDIVIQLQNLITGNNMIISIFFGFFVIILESMIPILPLALFIAINMIVFGNVLGFFISWLATIIGCSISFWIFRKGLSNKLYKNIEKSP